MAANRFTPGDNCMLGPNVSIYTAGHSLHLAVRNSFLAYGAGVEHGDNVWVGGSAVICPGVKIGSNTVIGAGSVVTLDIPAWSLAAGNPCRVIRKITEADRRFYFRDRALDSEAEAYVALLEARLNDSRRFPVGPDREKHGSDCRSPRHTYC